MSTRKKKDGPVEAEIGRRIREARLERKVTQETLAEAIGITYQQIQKYEAGRDRVAAGRLWRISHVLGCPVDRLLPDGDFFRACDLRRLDRGDEFEPAMHR
ncbi:helix-turn-helix domain-containing protein [Aureimonas leprariae]|uniref:Helix-turn-helix transcriptional regulator n=1 Tax=Plantimonas leprariae TaxID=2615207 RepID=A0A7V7TUP9_9HYPH|nr:helix-turn-helix transcriptional regulator [Aureimonas leprariae]KAB0676402.1 helix-turn-helix transcriptional regulator [Aureimonas leprariae]